MYGRVEPISGQPSRRGDSFLAKEYSAETRAARTRRMNCWIYFVLFILTAVSVVIIIVTYSTRPVNKLKTTLAGRKYDWPATCDQRLQWWQTGIIYQIYPRSFQDSNGDGVGDLRGIMQRLDHLKFIGVQTVWLSPVYKSPMKDFGYDVSDYYQIDPLFGNLRDFDAMLKAMGEKDIKLVMDFVPNHTSDLNQWFIDSVNRENGKDDWYMWADPKANSVLPANESYPNNWISVFSGSMWNYNTKRSQFYLHQFLKEQPDLNYTNPEVVQASYDVISFWLNKGVDGFRIDAIKHVFENPLLPDEVRNPNFKPGEPPYSSLIHNETTDYPPLHQLCKDWRKVIDKFSTSQKPRFAVGEAYDPIREIMKYYGTNGDEFHFPFNFFLLTLGDFTGTGVNKTVEDWMSHAPRCGWPNWVVGNHDNNRISKRRGNAYVRAVNAINLLLPGTPTTYYGEEINMQHVDIDLSEAKDPFALQNPDIYKTVGRDPERTPMQWNRSANAGFTNAGVKPWLPVASDYQTRNVAAQRADTHSDLWWYRSLANLRSSHDSFKYPGYQAIKATKDVFAFLRFHRTDTYNYLVVTNLGQKTSVDLSAVSDAGDIVLSSTFKRVGTVGLAAIDLDVGEVLVFRINK
ncbi:Maltase A3 [Trichoplax sp. H2]|nr:Maltase A3 [Trichoplax sp. H2]|eukprot:RDD39345.1 Maltase A3 [Trichoplax sp. H2]